MLEIGAYFSLPNALLAACTAFDATVALPDRHELITRVVELAVGGGAAECRFEEGEMTLVRVINNCPETRTLVSIHHDEKLTTLVSVVVCSASTKDTAGDNLVAHDGTEVTHLDLRGVVAEVAAAVGCVFKWEVRAKVARAALRQLPMHSIVALGDGDESALPSVVGEPPLAHAQPLAILPDVDALNSSLSHLSSAGAFSGVGEGGARFVASQQAGTRWGSIQTLQRIGAVVVSRHEHGDAVVRLNPQFVDWKVVISLWHPVAMGCLRSPVDALKTTKLELVIALRMEGWMPDSRVIEPHALGGARVYRPDLKQPLAYFAALHLARRVFNKGATRICHGFPNSYCRCLIQLGAEA